MSFLFIGSTGDNAGHTLLTWAVVRKLMEMGYRVGFVKPFGTRPIQIDGRWTDQDAVLFKEALGLPESVHEICPNPIANAENQETEPLHSIEELTKSIRKLSEGKDVLIVMGSKHIFFDDPGRPLPDVSLIPLLGADFILIHRYRKVSKSIYSILSVCSLLRDCIRGIIFNRVPPDELGMLRDKVMTALMQKGVPAVAALPEDPPLSFRSLREVKEILRGKVLWGAERLEQPVAFMTVGSHDLPADLMLFKRAYNKIVLLSPQEEIRKEGALSTRHVSGILVTGGRHPAPQMIEAATKAGVPLILVEEDTFAALERLEQSPSVLSSRDEVKIRRFSEMLDRENALDLLISRLRLPTLQRRENGESERGRG
jgi:hypothetical protein